jgi:hypothetical protein
MNKIKIKNIGNLKNTLIRTELNKILRKQISSLEGVKIILNAGCSQSQTDKNGTFYKDYFPSAQYYTLNNDPNIKDDSDRHFDMDIHDLSSIKIKFDLVICNCVLEHVRNPFIVAKQLEDVSNKYIFIAVPFIVPFHQKEDAKIKDYWRFTDNGLRELFKNCEEVWLKKLGSVIKVVEDKKKYWRWKPKYSSVGYVALFKKNN